MARKMGLLSGLVVVALLLVTFAGSALAAPPAPGPGANAGYGFVDRVTLQRVASLLGTTAEDVAAQLQQGTSLVQIAQSKNVTEQALIDTIVQPMNDRMDLQVQYGYLTQEQADTMLQYHTARVTEMINATPGANGNTGYGYGPCHGAGGIGPGGMMGAGGMMGFGAGAGGFGGRGMMSW